MLACATFEQVKAYGIGVAVAYPPDTDTPGFKTENVGKPEVTRLIGEDAGGLFSPTQASPTRNEKGTHIYLYCRRACRPPSRPECCSCFTPNRAAPPAVLMIVEHALSVRRLRFLHIAFRSRPSPQW